MINSFFLNKLSSDKLVAVQNVATNLNLDANWLLAVMYFETAKTFSPAKTNGIGSVGLIQFTRDKLGVNYKTINGVKYLLSDLAKMSFTQQLKVVEQYFKEVIRTHKITPKSFIDTYLAVFFPLAVGKSESFVFETKGLSAGLIAKQNPIFAKDGKVTKENVANMFKKWLGETLFNEIEVKKKCLICQNYI